MENTRKSLILKIMSIVCIACMILSMATCFAASGDGQAEFVQSITDNITADTMWGSLTTVAPILVFVFIFAFGYTITKRVLKGGSKGKFRM